MPGALKSMNFDGHDLFEECGLIIQSKTEYSAPARDVTSQAVPGRSGNLPFMYADTGQQAVSAAQQPYTITNPEQYDARPMIMITGSGNVDITIANAAGNKAFHLLDIASGTVIDSELMEVYQGGAACNSKMTTPDYPILAPGANTIQWSGSVQSLQIVPRWCRL
jgi:phage-related protein